MTPHRKSFTYRAYAGLFASAVVAAILGGAGAGQGWAQAERSGGTTGVVLRPAKESRIYDVGELVAWKLESAGSTTTRPSRWVYEVRKNNAVVMKKGELEVGRPADATISVTVEDPSMVYVSVKPARGDGKEAVAGAAVGAESLKPVVERPTDFDAFWRNKIEALKRAPANAAVEPGDSGVDGVAWGVLRMDHVDGGKVWGQVARPAGDGAWKKRPALVIFQWASPPYPLDKSWVTGHAKAGWLVVNVEPHDVRPDQPKAYYAALPAELKNYQSIGQEDREKSYFVRMYLGAYRAVDYVCGRDDWDGKTLVVMGTSMGGQQALSVAGLHPRVTHVIANVPAGCDLNAALHGRQAGYPFFPADNPKVMEAARYVDVINFAPGIKAKALVAMGFVDTVTPPAGIWTAWNLIPGEKEVVPLVDSPHNHQATPAQQAPYERRSREWLGTLVKGEDVDVKDFKTTVKELEARATVRGVERSDANSREAHRQLLAKAKAGKIDLYFLGDSITRRWGCSDPQYAELLENWRANFHGWNAANFGWGGDTTRNILWRIENGELDGVNPKAIVVLAGTNDLGAGAAPGEVVKGVKEIVRVCREKAPAAVIVVTGVFPREDGSGFAGKVEEVNRGLAKLAAGERVKFLNVNAGMVDAAGKLKEGIMGDGLHLTVNGYQVWADGLRPILEQILGKRGDVDHAPAPTGDPGIK